MAKRSSDPPQGPDPFPLAMAVRRLKEARDEIPSLEGLNHTDLKFKAWRENLNDLFRRNWPYECLPNFFSMVLRMGPGPEVTHEDLRVFREGLAKAKDQLDRILRNERELAEAHNETKITEIFLPPGSQHDAYQQIRQIISDAGQELIIVDNYVDTTLFSLLANTANGIAVRLLTYFAPLGFPQEARKFIQQYGRAFEIRRDRNDFHDRFIILDQSAVFHLGHSIKDAGNKAMMIHRVEDHRNVQAAIATFESTWASASPVQT